METDIENIYDPNIISNYNLSSKRKIKKSKRFIAIKFMIKSSKKIFYISIITIIIFMFKLNSLSQKKQRKGLTDRIMNLEAIINIQQKKLNKTNEIILRLYNKISINNLYKKFTEIINQKYKEEQNFFCDNLQFLSNNGFENQIIKANVNFNNKIYDIYVFSGSDAVSKSIIKRKKWEGYSTLKVLEALNFYTNKTKSKNEDLYILDIGANIGWYSFYLGKYGYNIMSFEPSERNFYILKKNYCLNRDINITIINKGLYTSEEACNYYEHIRNKGNGMVICHRRNNIPRILKKKTEIILTKLSNFIPFLSQKNVVFMKIDVEGSEEAAILSGIELISIYHIPFIFLEYCPNNLRLHDVNNIKFLEIFENNGYKISNSSFFDKNYVSIEYLAKEKKLINLYIIYTKILD
jgi:FkbM family methyltransferase